jgi:hypothetical protein
MIFRSSDQIKKKDNMIWYERKKSPGTHQSSISYIFGIVKNVLKIHL